MSDSESSPSKRTADGKAANYLFTGPGWKGEIPAGMKHFPIATPRLTGARLPVEALILSAIDLRKCVAKGMLLERLVCHVY